MRGHARIALLFLGLALVYAGPALLPGRTFAPLDVLLDLDAWKSDPAERVPVSNSLLGDVIRQFVAWDTAVLRLITEGDLPWVNRLAGEGAPLFANPQTALFSPFTWPRLMFGLDGWAVTAILKLLAAALCMYWFSREFQVRQTDAVLSAIVYATAGYTVVWLLFPITNVFALLPGLAAASLRLMRHPSMHNAALVVLFAALCTAGGHPETLFIGVVGIWIFLGWEAEKRPGLGFSAIVPSTVGALLGFALLSFVLVPFLWTLGDLHTTALRPQMPHGFRLWAIPSQILPGILGAPLMRELDLTALAGHDSFHHRTGGYVGAIVLLSIGLAWRQLDRSLRRGLIIGMVALVVSWYPPGLWSAFRHVPILRLLILEYAALLFVLFGALAAGPAVAIAAARQRKKIGAVIIAGGALLLVAGVLPSIGGADAPLRRLARTGIDELRSRGHLHQEPRIYEKRLDRYVSAARFTALRRVAIPGACLLVAGAALASAVRRRTWIVGAAAAAELVAFGVGYNPVVRMNDLPAEPEVIVAIRQLDPERRFMIAAPFQLFPANLATLYRVRDLSSYDLTTQRRVAKLLPAGYDPLLHAIDSNLSPEQVRVLGRLGVRFVLSRGDIAGARRRAGPPPPAVGVYEIEGAVPTELPANRPPVGVIAGLIVSLLAVLASAAWLRLYTLDAPTMQHFETPLR